MKAMIFAAGLGTRLRPLTNHKPKALVAVREMPLLEITIRRLRHYGFKEIIVNVHHFGEQIIQFLAENNYFDCKIAISDERDCLLDTGGGLKKAASFFDDKQPFLVCNADIISNINLTHFYKTHQSSKALATLAVRNRTTSRYLLFDENKELTAWKNTKTGEIKLPRPDADVNALTPLAFSGMHILSPRIFDYIKQEGKFSIIDVYLQLAQNHAICAYPHDEDIWLDVGKLPALEKAAILLDEIDF